jgi:hypothetical protein
MVLCYFSWCFWNTECDNQYAWYSATLAGVSEIQSVTTNMPHHDIQFIKWTVWCQEHDNSKEKCVTVMYCIFKTHYYFGPAKGWVQASVRSKDQECCSMLVYWACHTSSINIKHRHQKKTPCYFDDYKYHTNCWSYGTDWVLPLALFNFCFLF